LTNWDFLYGLFSKEAVYKGSLEKFRTSNKKKGTQEVDQAFLEEIEHWRELLAANISLRNELTERQLNYVIQKTIDRIIFLRICEDRGIENANVLQIAAGGKDRYKHLLNLFISADEKYNSGLFHFHNEKGIDEPPDTISESLIIDNKVLKEIIGNLYYPAPYEFAVLPADILGSIYERFLGKIIRMTGAHRVKVEEKPEVRKAGGVYYTPQYIVNYIVENTIGVLLQNKTPKTLKNFRIADPACGSGSFLINAYQYILDWYLRAYAKAPDQHKKQCVKTGERNGVAVYKLSINERKRILTSHIYGVDIDTQAVEVTKLSLLLKALEGLNEQEIQKELFNERVLPDLSRNIKCGNSLIGTDFYAQGILDLTEDDQYRINAFDWKTEFAEVFRDGGFDAVIGNPPWVSLTGKFGNDVYDNNEMTYLKEHYSDANTYMPNLYEYFLYRGLQILNGNGFFGYIIPDRLASNSQFVNLRKILLMETSIKHLVFRAPFPGIVTDTLILIYQKGYNDLNKIEILEYDKKPIFVEQENFMRNEKFAFSINTNAEFSRMISKIDTLKNMTPLSGFYFSTSGFGGKSNLITKNKESNNQITVMKGESINRYVITKTFWFDFKKDNITGRTTDKQKLGYIPKILIRKTGDRIIATKEETGVFPEQSLYFLYDNKTDINPSYVLGILNSKVVSFYFREKLITNKNSIAQIKKQDLDIIPIPALDLSKKSDKAAHDKLVALVDQMLVLKKKEQAETVPQAKTVLERQIKAVDKQIDALVYQLYGLTEEEIGVVEGEG
jgi:type I restriction-modification system DNA methylase subunit